MITQDEVRHVAKLAKLNLSDDKVAEFTEQLDSVLEFFNTLQEVDTDNVEETSQVTGLQNVTRPDNIDLGGIEDELLKCASHEVENHSVKIPKIM